MNMNLMKERDFAQKKPVFSKNVFDWKEFKRIRIKVNNRLNFEEKHWQKIKIEECGDNSGKVSWII